MNITKYKIGSIFKRTRFKISDIHGKVLRENIKTIEEAQEKAEKLSEMYNDWCKYEQYSDFRIIRNGNGCFYVEYKEIEMLIWACTVYCHWYRLFNKGFSSLEKAEENLNAYIKSDKGSKKYTVVKEIWNNG